MGSTLHRPGRAAGPQTDNGESVGYGGLHLAARDPTGAVIDSQSVKTTESGGPRGYDAGKKINGRKRHALVDTDGRGLVLEPHPASIQDRDGGRPLLHASRRSFPFIKRVFSDSGYAGERVAKATVIAVEIVRKNPDQVGFAVQPRRWVVERFFAWIGLRVFTTSLHVRPNKSSPTSRLRHPADGRTIRSRKKPRDRSVLHDNGVADAEPRCGMKESRLVHERAAQVAPASRSRPRGDRAPTVVILDVSPRTDSQG
jgi:transposase